MVRGTTDDLNNVELLNMDLLMISTPSTPVSSGRVVLSTVS